MKRIIPLIACLALSACEVGPDYARPDAPLSETFKEQPGWVAAAPGLAGGDTKWWAIYNDPILDGLENQIDISNQTLKQSEAAYRAAQAIVIQGLAAFYPTVSLNGSASYAQNSGSRGTSGVVSGPSSTTTSSSPSSSSVTQGSTIVASGTSGGTSHIYNLSGGASWELDVWGRIRRQVEEDVANAQASAADLEAARLAAEGSLATDYFELRYEDQLIQLLDQAEGDYRQSLKITENQYNAGVAAKTDVLNARTQLEAAESQQINAGVARAQFEHAIAVLTGQPPGNLAIPAAPLTNVVPVVPAGVPSTLLQRRPDIAEAERQMEAASAAVGVAEAAYYPDVTLSANAGFVGTALSSLIQSSNSQWSMGPSISETLFDGGLRSGEVEQAKAAYDQAVAAYRQTVLTALQAVEDDLASQAIYTKQAEIENQTVKDAEEAARLSLNQYKAGTIVFSNVIQAQTIALSDEETALQLRQNRLVATVSLIEALGGGWDAGKLPTRDQVEDVPYGVFP